MKLVVGLGNPGREYQATRHNIGWRIIDTLAVMERAEFSPEKKIFGEVAAFELSQQRVILLKPTTFMNESGRSVQAVKQFYKLNNSDIWVVSDDFELPLGTVRVRQGGGSGGQNGLGSIIESIGEDFWRIRIGIGGVNFTSRDASQYVLGRFSLAEESQLQTIIPATVEHIRDALSQGLDHVSHNFL